MLTSMCLVLMGGACLVSLWTIVSAFLPEGCDEE